MKTFEKIITKYSSMAHDPHVYNIGGGLSDEKFASRRHEAAKDDPGKITLGKAVQLFAKASGLSGEEVKQVIKYAVPNMEWHHAGKLPKQYGGGMKKTYFLNSVELTDLATNWHSYFEKVAIAVNEKRLQENKQRDKNQIKQEYLQAHAKKVIRATVRPELFYETDREMNGKYGWFSSYGKTYNLTEYYTGWVFASEDEFNEFNRL